MLYKLISGITPGTGRTREGPRFSIIFVLYAKKVCISRACKCATRNRLQCAEKNTSISM